MLLTNIWHVDTGIAYRAVFTTSHRSFLFRDFVFLPHLSQYPINFLVDLNLGIVMVNPIVLYHFVGTISLL